MMIRKMRIRSMTGLGALVVKRPARAASKIKAALRARSESEAAEKLGVSLRSLRRYRRTLEESGHLDEGLTPMGRRSRTDSAA